MVSGAPGFADVMTVVGFNFVDGLSKSNAGFMIVIMKPFEERNDPSLSVHAAINYTRAHLDGLRSTIGIPFNLPPIMGLGTGAGFEFQIFDLQGAIRLIWAPPRRGLLRLPMRISAWQANTNPGNHWPAQAHSLIPIEAMVSG